MARKIALVSSPRRPSWSAVVFPLVFGLSLSATWLNPAAAQSVGPSAIVRTATDQVLAILRDTEAPLEARWQQITQVLRSNFDYEGISRSVLANNWRRASPREQNQFVIYFSQYLEEVYRTRFEAYSDQTVTVDREVVEGDWATVDTTIRSGGRKIPVSYRMQRDATSAGTNTEGWLVSDVIIEGQSMVSSYRNTTSAITQTSGMEGLLKDIQRRINKQKVARQQGGDAQTQ